MLDMARRRPTPPSLLAPPDWLVELPGYELFELRETDDGWSAFPAGVDERVEFPGGTWRVTLVMPVDLSIADGAVDPLVLLTVLADGAAKVEDEIDVVVAHCRATGKSWTEIGRSLGMSKQAAWEKFSGED
jgi:hypothetical protein